MPLSRKQIAWRAAQDLGDGTYVNLGIGLPTLVADVLPDNREIVLQSENGVLGVGPAPGANEIDMDLVNAGKQPVTLLKGGSYVHHTDSFLMIRGQHLDYALLGAFEVAENGDLANWTTDDPKFPPGVGGAMDLAAGAQHVFVTLEHTDSHGNPKLVERCGYPLTMPNCVDAVITDLALLRRPDRASRFVLEEVAAGFSVEEVLSLTGMTVDVADEVGVMQENWG